MYAQWIHWRHCSINDSVLFMCTKHNDNIMLFYLFSRRKRNDAMVLLSLVSSQKTYWRRSVDILLTFQENVVCRTLLGDNFFILCYFKLKLTWYVSRFLCSQKRSFSWIRQKTKNILINPHWKNCQRYQHGRFLQWGSMGKFFVFCRMQLKLRFWLHKKVDADHVILSS